MLRFPISALLLAALLLAACGDAPDDEASAQDTAYADEMAEQHAGDSTNATAIAREPVIPVETETVNYGPEAPGYMAYPAPPDSVLREMAGEASFDHLPGLIVVHEWWGLNDNIKTTARRLAGEGFRVLAVDLYDGQVAESPDQARSLVQTAMADEERLVSNMQAAHEYLSGQQQAPRVGVMGWCFGGGMALSAALAMPSDLDAVVIYYGRVQGASREQLQQLQMPILGIFGGEDQSIPTDAVRSFEQTLDDLGKDARIEIYPNAGHAFANPTGKNYVADAAEDAWDMTTAFLKEHLYAQGE